ncbi:MAG: 30S ribosomal protein S2 [Candidatus Yonathbacteria bacterium]|nr:30S ribosomal protein S2 [Candidatus Yonathbacteria bacterium]
MSPMSLTKEKELNTELVEKMFKAGAHFGYSKARRHPSAKPFIFGAKNSVEIIDLEKTQDLLITAREFVKSLAREGKKILFVGTKNESRAIVKAGAASIDMPYVEIRWIGGTISNFTQIKKRLAHLEDLMEKRDKGGLTMYTKKERLLFDREIARLLRKFEGLLSMKELPAAFFVIDSRKEHIAVQEARDKRIPIVSISNSDCDIKEVDYPILGNDASVASVKFFVDQIVSAYKEGRAGN